MLMTGFCSLNVHDSLTFDGTELCLHPDLFPNSSAASASGSTNGGSSGGLAVGDMIEIRVWDPLPQRVIASFSASSTASVITAPAAGGGGGTSAINSPATTPVLNRSPPEARRNSSMGSTSVTRSTASLLKTPPKASSTTTPMDPTPPNPLTPNPTTTPPAGTTPTGGVAYAAVAGNSSTTSAPAIPNHESATPQLVPTKIQSTDLRPRALSMANSLAYSVDSENPQSGASQAAVDATSNHSTGSHNVDASSKGAGGDDNATTKSMGEETNGSASAQDAGTTIAPPTPSSKSLTKSPNPPAKTVTLPSASAANAAAAAVSLPPVFPRTRNNTAESVPLAFNLQKPKPMARRGRTSASSNTTTGSSIFNNKSLVHPLKRPALHSRDISDVTVDTQQLDNLDFLQAAGALYNGHGNTSSADHLIPPENPNSFPRHHSTNTMGNMSTGSDSRKLSSTHSLRLSFVLLVTNQTLTTLKGNTRTQISMLRQVADLYSLSRYDTVTVHKIAKEDEEEALKAVSADYVVVSIKDQFISRGDMLYFQNSLKGSWIYEGVRLMEQSKGIKAHAREIRHGNASAKSGIVTDKTMITFRSRSARIFWLVQLSSEMWDYSSPYDHVANQAPICEIYFDKWIRFLHKLFTKWKDMEVTHSLTVIFFSRTLIYNGEKSAFNLADVYGRPFDDHYKTVIENETCLDWHSLVVRIKEAFVKHPYEVGWSLDRRPTNASQGNVLEAINLTLNLMQFHYLDRDLHRTGQSLVVISPGCGLFEVNKRLAEITYKRMMDHGIGSDMLSLGLPPLHIAPIFLYAVDPRIKTKSNGGHYEVPHWMHLSFISYDRDDGSDHAEEKKDSGTGGKNKAIRSWLDTYEVASNGFLRPKVDVKGLIGGIDSERASSFSAIGNAAATPVKSKSKAKQERQLIEGRDFRDILDACKPKVRSMIPSPLLFILKQIMDQDGTGQTKLVDEPRAGPLVEWGTANTNEMIVQDRLLIQHLQSRKKEYLAQRGSAKNDSAPGASAKIDYSQILSTTLLSTSPQIVQLQRSNSMKLDQLSFQAKKALSPFLLREDSLSASASTASGSSIGKFSLEGKSSTLESKLEVIIDESGVVDQNQHIAHLRQLMEDHDTVVCSSLRSEPQPSRGTQRSSNALRSSDSTVTSRKQNSLHAGGIADALSQYERKKPRESRRILRPLSDLKQTSFKQDRPRKSSPLLQPLNERGHRKISPVVLSPPNPELNSIQHDATTKDEISRSFNKHASPRDSRLHVSKSGFGSTNTLPALDSSDLTGSPIQFLGSSMSERRSTRQKPSLLSKSPSANAGMLQSGTGTPQSTSGLSSPPRSASRDRSSQRRSRPVSNNRHGVVPHRQVSYNPFRQSDEDEVLATRSHSRRRWSHVFAEGEVEFKRHAGPIWNSLTSPAILPLSVDYLPSPQELRDESRFLFTPYSITLSGIDASFYNTHDELIMEMVRMRVTQDYQIVTANAVSDSNNRVEQPRQVDHRGGSSSTRGKINRNIGPDKNEASKHYLSMGHIIQVLHFDPTNDTIEVVVYLQKTDYKDYNNHYNYRYLLYADATKQYVKSAQTFKKYKDPYRWNKSDNIMCGEEEPELLPGMRTRRHMFGLLPPTLQDEETEKAYISRFKRLLDYLGRLREKEESKTDLGVEIKTSPDGAEPTLEGLRAIRRRTTDSLVRFIVRLQRGKKDPIEWIEISIESVFVPTRSYKIIFNWLVGSSSKVEGQIQLLHRRCTQFGLHLIAIPQTTTFENMHQHSFSAPTFICVRNKVTARGLDNLLKSKAFVYDGLQMTEPAHILEFIENSKDYEFARFCRGKTIHLPVVSKKYIHRSGALFVRMIPDSQGLVILAVIENQRDASRENGFKEIARTIIIELQETVGENKKVDLTVVEEEEKAEAKMAEESEKIEPKPKDVSKKTGPTMVQPKPEEESENVETKLLDETEKFELKSVLDGAKVEPMIAEENEVLEPTWVEGTEKDRPTSTSDT